MAVLHLKTRAQYQATMAAGVVAKTAHFALHRLPFPLPSPSADHRAPELGEAASDPRAKPLFVSQTQVWLGIVLPKRWARRSVTRHAIKRQIYALAETADPAWPIGAHVVRQHRAFDPKRFISAWSEPLRLSVREELLELYAKAASRPLDAAGQRPQGTSGSRARRAPSTASSGQIASSQNTP